MEVTGLDTVLRNLGEYENKMLRAVVAAGEEIGALLENHAKTDHGDTPRAAGYVYPGGGVKRFREGGKGWGDVTGATNISTKGQVSEITRDFVMVALSAGTEYSVFLELARDGKWAWLFDSLVDNKDKIIQILARHLRGVTV